MTEDEMIRCVINSMDISLRKPWETKEQRSLGCCSSWGHKESDINEQLNNKI